MTYVSRRLKRRWEPPEKRRARIERPAESAVGDVLALYRITEAVRFGRLETEWEELVGPKVAKHTWPDLDAGVRNGVLWIDVSSAVWLQELNLLKPKLLASMVQRFGDPCPFRELRFRLAGRYRREQVQLRARRPPPPPPRPPPTPASGQARQQILDDVARVEDDDLREIIARVRIAYDR